MAARDWNQLSDRMARCIFCWLPLHHLLFGRRVTGDLLQRHAKRDVATRGVFINGTALVDSVGADTVNSAILSVPSQLLKNNSEIG